VVPQPIPAGVYGDLGILGCKRRGQAAYKLGGQEGAVAGYRNHEAGANLAQGGVEASQRSGEVADPIAEDRMSKGEIAVEVPVGVDQEICHLRLDPLDHPFDQGADAERLQALVDPAHAAATAPGQHETGDCVLYHIQSPLKCMEDFTFCERNLCSRAHMMILFPLPGIIHRRVRYDFGAPGCPGRIKTNN
jgi:hypothetical protein